jgi:hypothetical protein
MTKRVSQKLVDRVIEKVENGEVPRYLYKYRILNTPGNPKELYRYTEDIITKSVLWHPSPADLNDPFDCHINFDGNLSRDEVKQFVNRLFAKHSREQRRSLFDKFCKYPKLRHDIFMGSVRKVTDKMGLCSYGTSGDNILMCFKFDLLADPSEYIDIARINYSKEYPKIKVVNFELEHITALFSTKSDIWSYENEWRVFTRTGPGLIPFKKSVLTEIIFGCSADDIHIHSIQELIKSDKDYSHVALKKAVISKQSFALDLRPL